MTLKPMLACKDASVVQFPCFVSPKIDGIRALVRDGVVLSRSLKPIPNAHVQKLFGRSDLEGLDGELVVGPPTAKNCMQATTSGVMSEDGEPDVTFYAFDVWNEPTLAYISRYARTRGIVRVLPQSQHDVERPRVAVLDQMTVCSPEGLDKLEAQYLELGYEGAMVRNPQSTYKMGRAGKRGWELVKLKRFSDGEARIIGFVEREHNDNEKTVDNLGHSKRSTHQANKRPAGDLGAFVCELYTPVTFPNGGAAMKKQVFNIGTGFSAAQRAQFWACREVLEGKIVKFKHFDITGVVDVPRIPVFVGFRDARDM